MNVVRLRRGLLPAVILIAVLVYAATGFYFVRPDQRGVVRWLGAVPAGSRAVSPGLHYALPWPFCRVDRPQTEKVRRVYVGMQPQDRTAIARGNLRAMSESPRSDMLTGDVNILKVTMIVQYQVTTPLDYLFGTGDPDALVGRVVESTLIEELAGVPVDQALTAFKAGLQNQTLARSQDVLDGYRCGVRLVSADLEAIEPPRAIVDAFQDVVSAQKDGERVTDQAVSESNSILSQARGQAVEIREAALGYRRTRVSGARGESARFTSLLTEYQRHPEILKRRLLLERMETLLPRLRTINIDEHPGDPPTDVKIVDPAPR